MKIEIRYTKISDAKRFFEILNNPNFIYFTACPETLEDQKDYLRKNIEKRKNNFAHGFSILGDGKVIGGCGIKIRRHREYIGEIGYFIDEKYWGKGITTKAVKILEKFGFEKLGLTRIEILMNPENTASERVAIKCGYEKEGTMKKCIKDGDEFSDAHLYAKVL